MIPIASEFQEQCALIKWASLVKIPGRDFFIKDVLIHIPNEGKREAHSGANLVKAGLTKGWPDLFFAWPFCQEIKGEYVSSNKGTIFETTSFKYLHGLFIEMKSKRGKLTKDQQKIMSLLESVGYKCIVAYGWEEARNAIIEYLK